MDSVICDATFDEERALYHLQNATVERCVFAGPADGESALKESQQITVRDCRFSLRYPLWHTRAFRVDRCRLDEGTRAALWYAADGDLTDTAIEGVKCLRECERIRLSGCTVRSPEFGWRCRGLTVADTDLTSEYAFFETRGGEIRNLTMRGKYSFQYTEDLTVADSRLDTKDAFWHSRNVTVRNCTLTGEYLGWYSRGLTLIDCRIRGTQPLCYCEGLRLIGCTMEDTDLSFEYSDVQADIRGTVLSVKNPKSGEIVADGYGAIVCGDAVIPTDCRIRRREPG